ncbi:MULTISPECIES: hypothetical protein [Bacillaceae]|uniref:Uncharacterized protein n=1 Tax=Evansella alkalicola TaxID=745819 RepID=A0ABS6K1Y0_9BACI|nr:MULTISPECIES: hypothetical protein [Bacillaceae]MBU9724366.1 hypothetical protein [Bacillus alkalicola]
MDGGLGSEMLYLIILIPGNIAILTDLGSITSNLPLLPCFIDRFDADIFKSVGITLFYRQFCF